MKKKSEKILFEGNWLSLKESVFISKEGKDITWESIERKYYNLGIIVIARLIPSYRYILIRQYRFPLNNYIIGFPAGMITSLVLCPKSSERFYGNSFFA